MKALQVYRNAAPLEALRVADIEKPEPGPGQVRIKVAAASLNFNDIDRCYGRRISVPLTPPFTLGMDACGVVDAAGAGAEQWIGKRVVGLTFFSTGGLAEYAIAMAASVFDAPPAFDDAEAAAFIIPFHTAYLALIRRAHLSAGETLLVHSGASSVGSAAIQIGVAAGARVFATAGSAEKADYCRALGAEFVINHREQKFDEAILDYTNNVGANVILDLAGGEFVEPSWRCVALEGRYVAAGFADDEANGYTARPLRPTCAANFSVIGVMLAWAAAVPPEMRRMGFNMFGRDVADSVHNALLQWIEQGRIRPIVQRIVKLEEAPAALVDQEQRRTTGRTVVAIT